MPLELKTEADVTPVLDSDLVPDGAKDVTYYIRHLTKEVYREIVKSHTQKVPNRRTHQKEDVTDWQAVTDAQLDYALTKWDGVNIGGKAAECNAETRQLLDGPRVLAILDRAGANEIASAGEGRAESFREAEKVR
jgi:hypothetical protein